jgi:hypothetical protein
MANSAGMFITSAATGDCRVDIKDLIENEIAAIFVSEAQKAAKEFKEIGRSSKKRREKQHS